VPPTGAARAQVLTGSGEPEPVDVLLSLRDRPSVGLRFALPRNCMEGARVGTALAGSGE